MLKQLILRILSLFMSIFSLSKFREFIFEFRNDFRFSRAKRKIKNLKNPAPYKLNLGCGDRTKEGWLNIDVLPPAELRFDVRRGLPFPNNTCTTVYLEHMLEHMSYPDEIMPFLKECWRVLAKNGIIHIGVPDGDYLMAACMKKPIDPEFLKKARMYGWYPAYCQTGFEFINHFFRLEGEHKYGYDFETLESHLKKAGFINVKKRDFDGKLDSEQRREGTLYVVAEKL